MTEKNKKELHDTLISNLQSKQTSLVTDSIRQLRQSGETEDIPVLMNTLLNNPDDEVKMLILELLADVKDEKAGKIFIDAILDDNYIKIRKDLVGICWESSIDFTDFTPVFVQLLIDSDFETSFEAFTVLENLTGSLSEDVKQAEKEKLKNAITNASSNQKKMLHEAIHALDLL